MEAVANDTCFAFLLHETLYTWVNSSRWLFDFRTNINLDPWSFILSPFLSLSLSLSLSLFPFSLCYYWSFFNLRFNLKRQVHTSTGAKVCSITEQPATGSTNLTLSFFHSFTLFLSLSLSLSFPLPVLLMKGPFFNWSKCNEASINHPIDSVTGRTQSKLGVDKLPHRATSSKYKLFFTRKAAIKVTWPLVGENPKYLWKCWNSETVVVLYVYTICIPAP